VEGATKETSYIADINLFNCVQDALYSVIEERLYLRAIPASLLIDHNAPRCNQRQNPMITVYICP
jgi:hypothetical protein